MVHLCQAHHLHTTSSSLITSFTFLIQVLQKCEQAGCCNKHQGTQELVESFPHLARQEGWGAQTARAHSHQLTTLFPHTATFTAMKRCS